MRTEKKEIAVLRILIATSERALEAFDVAENPVDADFVSDLTRILERSRQELAALVEASRDQSDVSPTSLDE